MLLLLRGKTLYLNSNSCKTQDLGKEIASQNVKGKVGKIRKRHYWGTSL